MARAVDMTTLAPGTAEEAARYIAENLREADRFEVEASTGLDPLLVVPESWRVSTKSWLILDRTSLPIGMMGAAPHMTPGLGIAWMLGTPDIEKESLSIARQTRRYVEEMHEEYPVLFNYVDARNELSMKWLQWSGFNLVDASTTHGPFGRLFFQFTRTA